MKLEVKREIYNKTNTIGKLYIDGKFFAHTLEDVERYVKEMNDTCIPKGEYKVILDKSIRFKKILPLIYNVSSDLSVIASNGDKWRGVRIHGGNTEADTSGCILVAYNTDGKKIWGSASNALVAKLTEAKNITLTIS